MPNHVQNRIKVIGSKEQVKKVLESIQTIQDDGSVRYMDFNKIVPMPDGLDIDVHSGIELWVDICTGKIDFNQLFQRTETYPVDMFRNGNYGGVASRMKASIAMEHLTGMRKGNVTDLSDSDFEIFVQALKNVRQYGVVYWYDWAKENWGTKWNAYETNDERNTSDTVYFQTAWSSPIELIEKLSRKFPEVEIEFTYADEDSGSNVGKGIVKYGKWYSSNQPENQSNEAYEIYFELHPDSKENYHLVDGKYEWVETED